MSNELEININDPDPDVDSYDDDTESFIMDSVNTIRECKEFMNTVQENNLPTNIIDKLYETKFSPYQKTVYDVVNERWDYIGKTHKGHPEDSTEFQHWTKRYNMETETWIILGSSLPVRQPFSSCGALGRLIHFVVLT